MTRCRGCGDDDARPVLDLGLQPLCNRFVSRPGDPEFLHPMVVGSCASCGLVQLIGELVPADEMRPRVDWITYREPEKHLDHLAQQVAELPGLTAGSTAVGVSFKDDSLLTRLRERLGARTYRLDASRDLGIKASGAGVETIQHHLNEVTASRIAHFRGRADIVVARHILEHAHEPHALVDALFQLARPGGYVLLEAPDCTRGLDHGDASTLWEEHAIYLTPGTFRSLSYASRLETVLSLTIPSEPEGLVIGVFRRSPDGIARERSGGADLERGDRFAQRLQRLRRVAASQLRGHGRVALFGAGHLGCTFVDLLDLKDAVEFFVDDHPQKRGRFMPGNHLPIRGSEELISRRPDLCFLSFAPESEQSVVGRNAPFLDGGGRFASIFPGVKPATGSPVLPFEAVIST